MAKDTRTLTYSSFNEVRKTSGVNIASITVLGKATPNDGYGGTFYWDDASTAPDDNDSVLQKSGLLTGRWIRAKGQDGNNIYEKLSNKQNNLDSDGTGTKYPTVDAVNVKVADLEEQILNVSGDKNFVFEQGIPSISWTIDHPLNKIPSVTVVDSAGTVVEGEVTVLTNNQVVVNFSAAFSGKAILN